MSFHKTKALIMVYLMLTITLMVPLAYADHDPNHVAPSGPVLPPPDEACLEKGQAGEDFVEIMDTYIRPIEAIASILQIVATMVNTIDWVLSLASAIIGMIGPGTKPGNVCCNLGLVSLGGACGKAYADFVWWENIKSSGLFAGITSVATCACCSGAGGKENRGDNFGGKLVAGAGGSGGYFCPLGSLSDSLGGMFSDKIDASGKLGQGGLSQFHISAFDNIYLAVGCMCPVAILHNLRKLKTIYQVNTCCVKEACQNGVSPEACDKQLDQALCMYWEGSIIKSFISIIASVITSWAAQMFAKIAAKGWLAAIESCVNLIFNLVEIPNKITALQSSWEWLESATFGKEPKCSDLGFDRIEDELGSGFFSNTRAFRENVIDTNGDGIGDTIG